jgi:RNA polymerase sigma-70 factor (ECF subfamily)
MKTTLEQLRDLLAGTAAHQAVDEIREEFRDPASGTSMLFAAMKAIADRPFAIDWAGLAEAAEELEVESADPDTGLGSVPLAVAMPSASAFLQDKEKTRLEQVRDILAGRVYGKEPQLRAGPAVALEPFRSYLETLMLIQIDPRLRSKFSMSDIVQNTLVEAWRDLERIQALDADRKRWLRRMLVNYLLQEINRWRAGRRDPRLEQTLEAAAAESSCRLQNWLAVEDTTPSERLVQQEEALQLLEALSKLDPRQREALILQKYHGWKLAQIAEHLGRTVSAVELLLRRGLEKLRRLLSPKE